MGGKRNEAHIISGKSNVCSHHISLASGFKVWMEFVFPGLHLFHNHSISDKFTYFFCGTPSAV